MLGEYLSVESVLQSAQGVAKILCFRAFPIAGYVVVRRGTPPLVRILVATALVLLIVVVRPWGATEAVFLGLGYLYFVVVSLATYGLSAALRNGQVTLGAVFALNAGLFFVLPFAASPPCDARVEMLVLGWDLMLAAYSYCVDTSRPGSASGLSDCLFFLLVNPALVYAHRGTKLGEPRLEAVGVFRAVAGLLTSMAALAFVSPMSSWANEQTVLSSLTSASLPTFLMVGLVHFIGAYARQSGVASLQIGMMRLVGHEIPERFERPLLARNPAEFWRRWNTYVSGWMLRYVFFPSAISYGKRGSPRRRKIVQGLCVLGTFAVIGLLHDAFAYAVDFTITMKATLTFIACGSIVVLWSAVRVACVPALQDTKEPLWFFLVRIPIVVLLWLPIVAFFSP